MSAYDFLSGAVTFGFYVCGLFFLRFWRQTRDALFLAFALAFGLLGTGQAILAVADVPTEQQSPIYLVRLAAFLLILMAIVCKNNEA